MGRLLDGAHVPDSRQRHIQRPGDGRGGEGQHVHLPAELLQLLLVADAEALLLVNNKEPQVLKADVLLEQPVGADEQVNLPRAQLPQDLPALPRRLEPAQYTHRHREAAKAAHRGGVVLLGQNGGGHQDCRLLPVQDALHHRPEGHLGLAVAHIAAEEPVHGRLSLHIPLDVRDTPELVLGLLIVEGRLKLLLPGAVRGEGEPRLALALGVEGDKALGQVLGGGLGPALLLGPVGAPQLTELGPASLLICAAADVLGH